MDNTMFIFSCNLEKQTLVSFLSTLIVFEQLTWACFLQIALELYNDYPYL